MSKIYSWHVGDDEENGPVAQIDMLIERADKVINLCEIKFADSEYIIDKSTDSNLRWKRVRFQRATRSRYGIHITLITTFGLVHNTYAGEVQSQVTADDLFEPTRE